ncbi:MAG: hypothetical protein ACRD2K_03810 [Terriglobales bacterium]
MSSTLFPPLLPTDLVFVPGPAEFMAIAEEELGREDSDGEFIDIQLGNAFFALPGSAGRRQRLRDCLNQVRIDAGGLGGGPDHDFTSSPVVDDEFLNEGGPAGEVSTFIELADTLFHGDGDLDDLVGVAGLIPDEGTGPQPPPPGAGDPEIPPTPTPPPEAGGAACVTFTITNCLAGGCGTFCACATDEGTVILPVGPGGECG